MKKFYPLEVIGLQIPIDHINPKTIQLVEGCRGNLHHALKFIFLFRHREIKLISDGKRSAEVEVNYLTILNFEDFMKEKLKDDTMNKRELKNISIFPIYLSYS